MINSWHHQNSHNRCFQNPKYGGKDTHGKSQEKPEVREHQVDVSGKKSIPYYHEMIIKYFSGP